MSQFDTGNDLYGLGLIQVLGRLHQSGNNEIDIKESIIGWFIRKPSVGDAIVIRDPKKIYQDGKEVGDVSGEVTITDNSTKFKEISNAAISECPGAGGFGSGK